MPPIEGFPWNDLREILHGGQTMGKLQNSEETLPKFSTPSIGRTDVTYDTRQTDLR